MKLARQRRIAPHGARILHETACNLKRCGNEVYYTACSLPAIFKNSCNKLHCQKVLIQQTFHIVSGASECRQCKLIGGVGGGGDKMSTQDARRLHSVVARYLHRAQAWGYNPVQDDRSDFTQPRVG